MVKVYRYNQYKNHVEVGVCAPGGMTGKLIFDNGNAATKMMPTTVVSSAFWQQVIDESRLVKEGLVTCVQTIEDGEEPVLKTEESYRNVDEVTSLQQAIDYVADNFGEKARTINEAIKIAHQNGEDFPNLKKKQ